MTANQFKNYTRPKRNRKRRTVTRHNLMLLAFYAGWVFLGLLLGIAVVLVVVLGEF